MSAALGDASDPGSIPGTEQESVSLGPVVVTDLELAVLEEEHLRSLGERPEGPGSDEPASDDPAEQAARDEARRSLVARGLLDADGRLGEDDDVGVLLTTLLDVRLGADVVLVAECTTVGPPGRRSTRLVHVLGDAACVEDLGDEGSHHLALVLDRAEVDAWVAAGVVPDDAAPVTGPDRVVRATGEDLPTALGHPTVLAELAELRHGPEDDHDGDHDGDHDDEGEDAGAPHHLVALGPRGCWVALVHPGRPLPRQMIFDAVDPGWVRRWARSAIAGSVRGSETTEGTEGAGGQGTMTG